MKEKSEKKTTLIFNVRQNDNLHSISSLHTYAGTSFSHFVETDFTNKFDRCFGSHKGSICKIKKKKTRKSENIQIRFYLRDKQVRRIEKE